MDGMELEIIQCVRCELERIGDEKIQTNGVGNAHMVLLAADDRSHNTSTGLSVAMQCHTTHGIHRSSYAAGVIVVRLFFHAFSSRIFLC